MAAVAWLQEPLLAPESSSSCSGNAIADRPRHGGIAQGEAAITVLCSQMAFLPATPCSGTHSVTASPSCVAAWWRRRDGAARAPSPLPAGGLCWITVLTPYVALLTQHCALPPLHSPPKSICVYHCGGKERDRCCPRSTGLNSQQQSRLENYAGASEGEAHCPQPAPSLGRAVGMVLLPCSQPCEGAGCQLGQWAPQTAAPVWVQARGCWFCVPLWDPQMLPMLADETKEGCH